MLTLQLQRFAGEKTERATPQRRREARREGQIPKSSELTSALALLAVLVALKAFGPFVWSTWTELFRTQLSNLSVPDLTQQDLMGLFRTNMWSFVKVMAPIMGVALVVGTAAAFAQVGPVVLVKNIIPDLQRINPISGLKRMFSMRTLAEGVKSILKLAVVGTIAYTATTSISRQLSSLMATDIATLPGVVGGMVFQLGIEIGIALLLLAVLDYIYQRYEFEKSIRMSREDIKEEFKRQEGDPQIKSQIRQRGRALAMRRMMQEVPKADVVVTNPTHFAVALRYEAKAMSAPIVVAKGQDEVAWRIRKIADSSGVPRMENRPLAQALYRTVEIGKPVPEELFHAVAEVLAHVYRMKQGGVSR